MGGNGQVDVDKFDQQFIDLLDAEDSVESRLEEGVEQQVTELLEQMAAFENLGERVTAAYRSMLLDSSAWHALAVAHDELTRTTEEHAIALAEQGLDPTQASMSVIDKVDIFSGLSQITFALGKAGWKGYKAYAAIDEAAEIVEEGTTALIRASDDVATGAMTGAVGATDEVTSSLSALDVTLEAETALRQMAGQADMTPRALAKFIETHGETALAAWEAAGRRPGAYLLEQLTKRLGWRQGGELMSLDAQIMVKTLATNAMNSMKGLAAVVDLEQLAILIRWAGADSQFFSKLARAIIADTDDGVGIFTHGNLLSGREVGVLADLVQSPQIRALAEGVTDLAPGQVVRAVAGAAHVPGQAVEGFLVTVGRTGNRTVSPHTVPFLDPPSGGLSPLTETQVLKVPMLGFTPPPRPVLPHTPAPLPAVPPAIVPSVRPASMSPTPASPGFLGATPSARLLSHAITTSLIDDPPPLPSLGTHYVNLAKSVEQVQRHQKAALPSGPLGMLRAGVHADPNHLQTVAAEFGPTAPVPILSADALDRLVWLADLPIVKAADPTTVPILEPPADASTPDLFAPIQELIIPNGPFSPLLPPIRLPGNQDMPAGGPAEVRFVGFGEHVRVDTSVAPAEIGQRLARCDVVATTGPGAIDGVLLSLAADATLEVTAAISTDAGIEWMGLVTPAQIQFLGDDVLLMVHRPDAQLASIEIAANQIAAADGLTPPLTVIEVCEDTIWLEVIDGALPLPAPSQPWHTLNALDQKQINELLDAVNGTLRGDDVAIPQDGLDRLRIMMSENQNFWSWLAAVAQPTPWGPSALYSTGAVSLLAHALEHDGVADAMRAAVGPIQTVLQVLASTPWIETDTTDGITETVGTGGNGAYGLSKREQTIAAVNEYHHSLFAPFAETGLGSWVDQFGNDDRRRDFQVPLIGSYGGRSAEVSHWVLDFFVSPMRYSADKVYTVKAEEAAEMFWATHSGTLLTYVTDTRSAVGQVWVMGGTVDNLVTLIEETRPELEALIESFETLLADIPTVVNERYEGPISWRVTHLRQKLAQVDSLHLAMGSLAEDLPFIEASIRETVPDETDRPDNDLDFNQVGEHYGDSVHPRVPARLISALEHFHKAIALATSHADFAHGPADEAAISSSLGRADTGTLVGDAAVWREVRAVPEGAPAEAKPPPAQDKKAVGALVKTGVAAGALGIAAIGYAIFGGDPSPDETGNAFSPTPAPTVVVAAPVEVSTGTSDETANDDDDKLATVQESDADTTDATTDTDTRADDTDETTEAPETTDQVQAPPLAEPLVALGLTDANPVTQDGPAGQSGSDTRQWRSEPRADIIEYQASYVAFQTRLRQQLFERTSFECGVRVPYVVTCPAGVAEFGEDEAIVVFMRLAAPITPGGGTLQYGVAFDDDGDSADNYFGQAPFELDMFNNTEHWYRLQIDRDGNRHVWVDGIRDGVPGFPRHSSAVVIEWADMLLWVIPRSELPGSVIDYRVTAFFTTLGPEQVPSPDAAGGDVSGLDVATIDRIPDQVFTATLGPAVPPDAEGTVERLPGPIDNPDLTLAVAMVHVLETRLNDAFATGETEPVRQLMHFVSKISSADGCQAMVERSFPGAQQIVLADVSAPELNDFLVIYRATAIISYLTGDTTFPVFLAPDVDGQLALFIDCSQV